MMALARLLEHLPRLVVRHPMPVDAISIAYAGAGTIRARVEGERLILEPVGAPVPSYSIDLAAATLTQVVAQLLFLGLMPTLLDAAAGDVQGISLLEEPARDLSATPLVFSRATNPLWRLLQPVGRRLDRAAGRIDIALAQLNLLQAAGSFADYWASLTGTPRHLGEGDDVFTARQLRELLRPRENNQALAALLEEDFGLTVVEVADMEPTVYRCTGPLVGRHLPGPRHNAAVCEVVIDDFPTRELVAAARRHVAAGVTVYVRGRLAIRGLGPGYTLVGVPPKIGEPPPMQVGVTPVGVGKVGA